MDYKKTKAPNTTITRNLDKLEAQTGNIYEAVMIMGKRANQVSVDIKQELNRKLEEFGNTADNLEEIFENREQIEISRFYERLPKPSLIAVQEYEDEEIFFKRHKKDKEKEQETE
jgi:DNA-directed RNA polymerase subunit K/omega